MYVTQLGGDLSLFETLVREFERAVDALLLIRGHRELLDDTPVLQSAIALRKPVRRSVVATSGLAASKEAQI